MSPRSAFSIGAAPEGIPSRTSFERFGGHMEECAMKHLKKRLMAGFLSVWMLCGSCVSSFAAETGDYAGGMQFGEGSLEQAAPEKPVRIQLPVVPEGSSIFDVIMDPSAIIKASGGGRYSANGVAPDFGPGRVFFKNTDESGTVSYSRNSDQLVITNAGMAPLEVSLSVTVNQAGKDFVFSERTDFTDGKGNFINKPALYLAIASEKAVSPITKHANATNDGTVTDATIKGWIPGNDEQYEVVWKDNQYQYQLKEGVTAEDLNHMYFYMTGAMNFNDAWPSVSRSDFSMTVAWNVAHARGADTDPYAKASRTPTVTVLESPTSKSPQAILAVDYGYGVERVDTVQSMTYRAVSGQVVTIAASELQVDGDLITIPVTQDIMNGSKWALNLTDGYKVRAYSFYLVTNDIIIPATDPTPDNPTPDDPTPDDPTPDDPTPSTPKAYVDVETAVSAANGYAILTVNFNASGMTTVTGLVYNKAGSTTDTPLAAGTPYVQVTGNTVTLKAIGAVFNGGNWRLSLSNANGDTAETMSFDIKTVGSYVNGIGGSDNNPIDDNPSDTPTETPIVKVTSAVTAANGYAVLEIVDWHSMNAVTDFVYNKNGSTTDFALAANSAYVQVSGNTVTVKVISAVFNGSNWRLKFSNSEGEEAFSNVFDLKTAG